MSKDSNKIIEDDFFETWDKEEKEKKINFNNQILNEKQTLEKVRFFHLDIERDFIEDKGQNETVRIEIGQSLKKITDLNSTQLST